MASYEEYLKLVKQEQASQLEKGKKAIQDNYDTSVKILEDSYAAGLAEAEENYGEQLRKNEVQRVLNQRAIERKAAEMGLTNSGFNLSQQTAAQLSYANAKGDIEAQKQKAVDTLAATMRAKIAELNIDKTSNLASLEQEYNNNAISAAQKLYDADVKSATKTTEKVREDYTKLINNASDADLQNKELSLASIYNWVSSYDPDFDNTDYFTNSDIRSLLSIYGLSEAEWRDYFAKRENIGYTPQSDIVRSQYFVDLQNNKNKPMNFGMNYNNISPAAQKKTSKTADEEAKKNKVNVFSGWARSSDAPILY